LTEKGDSMRSDADITVLFDLDGVLIDSRLAVTACIKHALRIQGLPERAPESLERFIGPPLAAGFAELTGQPQSSHTVLACLANYRERYSEVSLLQTTVVPGIPEALLTLSEDHTLAVATSKPLAFAEPLLQSLALRDRFALIAGPELDAHQEDKSTTIRTALATLGVTSAVMVGDRSFDILGAHACAIPAVGVTWGIGSRQELAGAGADTIIDSPSELTRAVDHLMRR